MGGARVTTLVTLRKCTLGHKREIKTLKFVSASTKGFKGGLAWIKPSKKDMAVTFSYYFSAHRSGKAVPRDRCIRHDGIPFILPSLRPMRTPRIENHPLSCIHNNPLHNLTPTLHPCLTLRPPLPPTTHPRRSKETTTTEITHRHHPTQRGVIPWMFVYIHGCTSVAPHDGNCGVTEGR